MPRGDRTYSKADLHLHTSRGDGMADLAELLDYVEEGTDLDLIAVTDHDQLQSALDARDLHSRRGGYSFDIIAGTEVTTLQGHLLALGIQEPVLSFRSLEATLDTVHRQGGLCLIPHPMSWLTRSVGQHVIERVLARRADGLWFDGIELSNQSPAGKQAIAKLRRLGGRNFGLAAAGGSDAHYLRVVGTSCTAFPGTGVGGLRQALAAGTTWTECGRVPSLADLGYGQVLCQCLRGLGATPRRVLDAPIAWARRRL